MGEQTGIVATTLPSFPWTPGDKLDAVPLNNIIFQLQNQLDSFANSLSIAIGAMSQPTNGVSVTLDWGGNIIVTPGTYTLTASAPYQFIIDSIDCSVGTNGGQFVVTVSIDGVPISNLEFVVVNLDQKVNTIAASNAVLMNSILTVTISNINGIPINSYVCINGHSAATLILDDPDTPINVSPLG